MNIAQEILDTHHDFAGAKPLVEVEGLSSPRVCNLLNRLVATLGPDEAYLEIGTWKGLTLCSAALGNAGKQCYACDKFRFWGEFTGPGFLAKRALYRNVARYKPGSAEVHFFHTTSKELFARKLVPPKVRVYFYDGDHSYEGTYHGVVAAAPLLTRASVLLMDDWNDPVIRKATYDGLRDAGLSIDWERSLEGDHSTDGWWNGLGVFHLLRA